MYILNECTYLPLGKTKLVARKNKPTDARPQRHEGMMMVEQKPSDKWKVNVERYYIREGDHL